MTFTLRKLTNTTAHVLLDGKVVGHVGAMAGGSQMFVNASSVHPTLAFASHARTLAHALEDLHKVAGRL
jgi:hypothetical protein